jgi:WD40 repeat protein
MPTPSAFTGNKTSGAYLVYLRKGKNGLELAETNQYGQGGWSIPYPSPDYDQENGQRDYGDVEGSVSPDGNWMVYYTGDTDTGDLTLNLMDLSDGVSTAITKLLSANYPNNFATAYVDLGTSDAPLGLLEFAFEAGIETNAWSPDSKYLAFAGQMDGNSSDLYLYNVKTKTVKRLSYGSQEIGWIEWSPDGKWILTGSSYYIGESMAYTIGLTSPDGEMGKEISTTTTLNGSELLWVNSHVFLTYNAENGIGSYQLQAVDIDNGKIKTLCKGPFFDSSLKTAGNWVLFFAEDPFRSNGKYAIDELADGLYLVDMTAFKVSKVDDSKMNATGYVFSRDNDIGITRSGKNGFLFSDPGKNIFYQMTDGSLIPTGIQAENVSVAPNQQQFIGFDTQAIHFYTIDNGKEQIINIPYWADISDSPTITWRPDSSGLFLASGHMLYMVDFSSNTFTLVDDQWDEPEWGGMVWVER